MHNLNVMKKNNLNNFGLDSLKFPEKEENELAELEIQQPIPKKVKKEKKEKEKGKEPTKKKKKAIEVLNKFDIALPEKKDNSHTTAAIKIADHLFIKKFARECGITNMEALHLIIETFQKLYEKHE